MIVQNVVQGIEILMTELIGSHVRIFDKIRIQDVFSEVSDIYLVNFPFIDLP